MVTSPPAAPAATHTLNDSQRSLIVLLWGVLIGFVVIGSLLPAASAVMVAVGRLHIHDKVQHFCAYLALAMLPVVGFVSWRRGILVGLSMFLVGVLLEGGQHFSPGRAVELGDVVANALGVACGVLVALALRARFTSSQSSIPTPFSSDFTNHPEFRGSCCSAGNPGSETGEKGSAPSGAALKPNETLAADFYIDQNGHPGSPQILAVSVPPQG
jgi:hypothetical protein